MSREQGSSLEWSRWWPGRSRGGGGGGGGVERWPGSGGAGGERWPGGARRRSRGDEGPGGGAKRRAHLEKPGGGAKRSAGLEEPDGGALAWRSPTEDGGVLDWRGAASRMEEEDDLFSNEGYFCIFVRFHLVGEELPTTIISERREYFVSHVDG